MSVKGSNEDGSDKGEKRVESELSRDISSLDRNLSMEASTSLPASSSSAQRVRVHGTSVPVDWLVAKHDASKYNKGMIVNQDQARQAAKDAKWAKERDILIAAAAAGIHLAMFSLNLAFVGMEGQPPDRYNPGAMRLRLGIKPSRYGNLDGSKKIYYENLARLEGVDPS